MIFVAVAVTVGMWFERFVIIVSSLHQDYLPSSWHIYKPTLVDFGILLGSFGLFFTLVLSVCASAAGHCHHRDEDGALPGAQPRHGGGAHD